MRLPAETADRLLDTGPVAILVSVDAEHVHRAAREQQG